MDNDLLIESRTPLQEYIIGNVAENAKKTTFGFDLGLKLAQEYGMNDIDQRESAMQATLSQFEGALANMAPQKPLAQAQGDVLSEYGIPAQSKYSQALANPPAPIPLPTRQKVKRDKTTEIILALASLFTPQAANAYAAYLKGGTEGVEDIYKQDLEKWQADTQAQNLAYQRLLEAAKSDDEWARFMSEFRARINELTRQANRQAKLDKQAEENAPLEKMSNIASALSRITDPELAKSMLVSVGVDPAIADSVATRIDDANKGKARKLDISMWNTVHDNVSAAINKTLNAFGFVDEENRQRLEDMIQATAETYGIDRKLLPQIPTGETLRKQYQDEAKIRYEKQFQRLTEKDKRSLAIALGYLGIARSRLKLAEQRGDPDSIDRIMEEKKKHENIIRSKYTNADAKYKANKAIVDDPKIPEPDKAKARVDMEYYKGLRDTYEQIIKGERELDMAPPQETREYYGTSMGDAIQGAITNPYSPIIIDPRQVPQRPSPQKSQPRQSAPAPKTSVKRKDGAVYENKDVKVFPKSGNPSGEVVVRTKKAKVRR